MSETKAGKIDARQRLTFAVAGVTVLRTLELVDGRLRYGHFVKVIGRSEARGGSPGIASRCATSSRSWRPLRIRLVEAVTIAIRGDRDRGWNAGSRYPEEQQGRRDLTARLLGSGRAFLKGVGPSTKVRLATTQSCEAAASRIVIGT